MTRRELLALACAASFAPDREYPRSARRTPVIDVTDLYHPPQDPGDNFDLIAAYALPEIDLRAVILDIHEPYRRPNDPGQHPEYRDPQGPREPGYVAVEQLNYIFDRTVPAGCAPFTRMRSLTDTMEDVPKFQQRGIELMLSALEESPSRVEVVSFGSARPIAVAYNRRPELMKRKVARVHLCAGSAPPGYLEWNVMLDPLAMVRVLRSDLPVAIYPCSTDKGPFDYGPNNTYWLLPDLQFIRQLDRRLQNYAVYAFERMQRADFLTYLDGRPDQEALDRVCARTHNVWETSVWMEVARRSLVRRADGTHRIIPREALRRDDVVLPNELRPVTVETTMTGRFSASPATGRSARWLYYRGDARANEAALREALPALYAGFDPDARPTRAHVS